MPWYYAGPEAKPVGPVTLEELQSLRARGTIAPETYVLEQTGTGVAGLAWKRYQEIFPALPSLPPLPPVPPVAQGMPAPPHIPPPVPPVMQTHPLFPSAAPMATHPPAFAPDGRPDPFYNMRPTNGWCAWGFGLGLAGFFFSWVCGIGLFPALASIPLCILGLMQLHKHREQTGQWLAIWGLVLSSLALVVSAIFILWLAFPIMKAHGMTVTEETTNDSQ